MAHPKPLALTGADPNKDYSIPAATIFAVVSTIRQGVLAAGYVAVGIAATRFAGIIDPAQASQVIVSTLPIVAAAGALKSAATHAVDAVLAKVHDGDEAQRIVRKVMPEVKEMLAVRRGALWLVSGPAFTQGPEAMSDGEYRAFKKGLKNIEIDEVKFTQDKASVRRFVNGKLDAGRRDLPAAVTWDLQYGRVNTKDWFDDGKRCSEAYIAERNRTRIENARASYERSARAAGVFEGVKPPHLDEILPEPLRM